MRPPSKPNSPKRRSRRQSGTRATSQSSFRDPAPMLCRSFSTECNRASRKFAALSKRNKKTRDAAIPAVPTPAGDGRLVTYLRLLDAQWDRADWQELAIDPAILHIDLVREPIRP